MNDAVPDNLSDDARSTLALLERYYDDRPITAREIAESLGLSEGNEVQTKRRDMRDVIKELRDAGHRVCANLNGYWLGRYPGEYDVYMAAVRGGAVFRFVAAKAMARAASERATGQGELFETAGGPWPGE